MPAVALPDGIDLLCYEELMAAADEDYAWPSLRRAHRRLALLHVGHHRPAEGRALQPPLDGAARLCHRLPDVMALRAVDRFLPVVPMFHVNAWGTPYAAPMAGASLVMPGRHLDGASLAALMNAERVTMSAGVPTVWLGLLQHLRASGQRLAHGGALHDRRLGLPAHAVRGFRRRYGVRISHGWGMTEMSPSAPTTRPRPATRASPARTPCGCG